MWIGRRPRSAVLAPLVDMIGYSEDAVPHRYERILPTATSDLMVNLHEDQIWSQDGDGNGGGHVSGSVFGGCRYEPNVIDTANQRALLYVGFRPGGAYPFFGPVVAHTDGRLVDLDQLWGGPGRELRQRLLAEPVPARRLDLIEQLLLDRVAALPAPDPTDHAIGYAAAALERGAAVRAVTEALGWTPKRFVRQFTTRVGLPPKRFARVRRLQRVLRAVASGKYAELHTGTDTGDQIDWLRVDWLRVDWARVAHEHGFYDQAHFVNDFKALTGLTPTAYHPRSPSERNHIPLES
jgi:AraC-like DNA-binding protein